MQTKIFILLLKKYLVLIVATFIIAIANFVIWYFSKDAESQIFWIGFILVWFNLLLCWLTNFRQPYLTYLFLSTSVIIEILLLVNNFWISTRVL